MANECVRTAGQVSIPLHHHHITMAARRSSISTAQSFGSLATHGRNTSRPIGFAAREASLGSVSASSVPNGRSELWNKPSPTATTGRRQSWSRPHQPPLTFQTSAPAAKSVINWLELQNGSSRPASTTPSVSRRSSSVPHMASSRDRSDRPDLKSVLSWLQSEYGIDLSTTASESHTPANRRRNSTSSISSSSGRRVSLNEPTTSASDQNVSIVSSSPRKAGILKNHPSTSTPSSYTERIAAPVTEWTDLSSADFDNKSKKGRRIKATEQTTERKRDELEKAHFAGLAMATHLDSDSSVSKWLGTIRNDRYRRAISEGTSYYKSKQGSSIFDVQKSLFDFADETELGMPEIWGAAQALRKGEKLPSSLQSMVKSYAQTHRGGRSLIDSSLPRGFNRHYKMDPSEAASVSSSVAEARKRWLTDESSI